MDVEVYQGLLEFNWNLLFSAVTMLVLYLILKRYFFEKVYCFMMDRQAQIDEQLNHARQTEAQALVLLEEYSSTLAHAEDEKRNILQQARKEAETRAEAILNQAKKEAEALAELAKRKNTVIATGGGAVKSPEAMECLKNALIIFIKRDIEAIIATADNRVRPLFTNPDAVREMYEKRKALYEKYCNFSVENEDINKCTRDILRIASK